MTLYDWLNELSDLDDMQNARLNAQPKKKKSPHDFEHDGAVVEYMDENMDKTYYAMSLGDQYIPFAKGAALLLDTEQIVGVYDYPLNDINTAFWEQKVDSSKLRPLWRKSFVETKKKIDDINAKIKKLEAERERYTRRMPKSF